MAKIIPAINADNFEEIKRRIKLVEPYVDWVQLDVADGTFTKNTIWHTPKDLLDLETTLNIEVHLMINDIEKRVEEWLLPPIKRIIFHIEQAIDPDLVIKKIQDTRKEPGMAVGPDDSWTHLAHFKNKVNFFQILGVHPGLPGQKIQEETYEQIRQLRKFCEDCIIEVDGGVNKENAKKLVEAGANILVTASAIFNGNAVEKNIKDLYGAFN